MSAGILDLLFMAGLKARVDGDLLRVSPAAKVTPVMRQMIRANKGALVAMLKAAEAPEPGPGGFPSGDGNSGEANQ